MEVPYGMHPAVAAGTAPAFFRLQLCLRHSNFGYAEGPSAGKVGKRAAAASGAVEATAKAQSVEPAPPEAEKSGTEIRCRGKKTPC